MTPAVRSFVESLKLSGKALDVGSMNINGCVRDLFNDYVGVDMRPGPNVDVVANADVLPFGNEVFNVVLCLEMLEHDATFWKTLPELVRVLRVGGSLVLTVRGIGFKKHEYPYDYWRFTKEGLESVCSPYVTIIKSIEDATDQGVFLHGVKQ